jgi:hypothetical protein
MNQPLVPQSQPSGQPLANRNLNQMLANLGPRSALAAQSKVDPRSLAAGIKPAFGSVTFKGKTWGIRHRGTTHPLLVKDPQTGQILGSAPSLDIVILKSATAISKAYYIEKYQENDYKAPDCWSTNGQVPDPASPVKQSNTCRGCRWDAFGSRMTEDNRKGKACQDAKRLAVVPAADLKNEFFGGPMLLKLPPSAFAGFSELEAALLQQGYEYFSVVLRLTFDHQVAYPKIVFTPIGVLNDYQMQEVLNLQELDVVDRILSEELYEVSADPNQPPEPTQQIVPQTVAQPQPIHAGPAEHQPQPQPTQAFQPVAPAAQHQPTPVVTTDADPGPIPEHLRRPLPQGNGAAPAPAQPLATAATGPVQHVQPQVAPTATPAVQPLQTAQPAPAQGQAEVVETPEQKIARLEAALAAAAAPKPRKRTKPVTPAGNQGTATVVQPTGGVALPLTTAQSTPPNGGVIQTAEQMRTLQASLPGESIVDVDDDEGDAPADLDSRIDALMGTQQ